MSKLTLHAIADDILEAPALAWSSLAWYWGLSFLGMGPRYMEYMQSGEFEIDKQFLDESNSEMNRIAGYEPEITIKQRFDRTVNFYEYCFVRGKVTSQNAPFDLPPDVDTLITLRNRMEAQSQQPDQIIKATTDDLLADNANFRKLWEVGGQVQRDERAKDYAAKVKEAMSYVAGEVVPRLSIVVNQLDPKTGFLKKGSVPDFSATIVEDMDDTMNQETQIRKLGDLYMEPSITGPNRLVSEGIIGRYYKAGHNLELAMWNDERKRELSGIHHATVFTWNQLMEIKEDLS